MSEDPGVGAQGLGPEDDLGSPIAELAELEEETPPGFLFRLLGALQRRSLASQLATFTWSALGAAFVELLRPLFSLAQTGDSTKGGSD